MLGILGVFLALTVFSNTSVKAFSISPLPVAVTQLIPVTVTWTRDPHSDPPQWHFEKSNILTPGGTVTVTVSNPGDLAGTLPITFTNIGTFELFAVASHGQSQGTLTGITVVPSNTPPASTENPVPPIPSNPANSPQAQPGPTSTISIISGTSANSAQETSATEATNVNSSSPSGSITSSSSDTSGGSSQPSGSKTDSAPSTTAGGAPAASGSDNSYTGKDHSSQDPSAGTSPTSPSGSSPVADDDLQSNHKNKTAIIIGTVLGGLFFILILAILILLCCRKRGRRNILNMKFNRKGNRRSWATASTTTAVPFYRDMMVRSKSSGIGSGGTNAGTNVNGSFEDRDVGSGGGGRSGLEESKVFMFNGDVARRSSIDKGSYCDDDDEEEEGKGEVDERTPVLPSLLKNQAVAQAQDNTRLFQVKRKAPPPLVPLRHRPSKPDSPTATSLYTSSHGTTVTTSSSSSFISEESEEPPSTYLTDHRPRLRARTDRQMFLQEQIMILRQEMISITNSSKESSDTRSSDSAGSSMDGSGGEGSAASKLAKLWERVRQLEEWQESDWALGLTNEEPKMGGVTIAGAVGLGVL
ncbi:hypothetical protein K435DRAFT_778795 [Dendrothele bispora CBS 962.96]|uniref:Mid2 domain-containing protein n=1 Tax=Dendrothele bispora (strain CBS 962.96) TaxID=1314807 RepID=A0A4S8M229_DENBC|nr:hypothetical protein K435DRAFT_778795 [Dendrothele bispora CBS 962.96]